MREFSTPLHVDLRGLRRLTDDLTSAAHDDPDAVLFARRTTRGWEDVSARLFHAEVRGLARGLIASGVRRGDRVGIWSRTRYEWSLADYALWYVGAVTVALFDASPDEVVEGILADAGAVAVLVESTDHRDLLLGAGDRLPSLKHVWCLGDPTWSQLRTQGRDVTDDELDRRRDAVGPDDLATLIYTSGTTGAPKGCMLTHEHLLVSAAAHLAEFGALVEGEDAGTVLALPLAYVFARSVQVIAVRARVRVAHVSDVRTLLDDLAEVRPTFLLGVPRLFERIVTTAAQQATADGHGRRFDKAVQTAIDYSRARSAGDVPLRLRARHRLQERAVYAPFRESLGGRLAWGLSGGAPLGERLVRFLDGAGITVLEGYGLTETSAAVTANVPGCLQIGTVGRPLPGCAVRVAEDGELLVSGGQVFAGYWDDAEATAAVLDADGWLHTGDLGEIGDDGFVRVTGRQRELIVTASGKQVAPNLFEDRLRQHPLVDHSLVVGDGRPFVAALITLDRAAAKAWAAEHGRPTRMKELVRDRELRAQVQSAVDQANSEVSPSEAIRRFTILRDTWSEDSGELTPSLKLRRQHVTQRYGAEVEALFAV